MPTIAESDETSKKLPWDVRLFGWLGIVAGPMNLAVGLLTILGIWTRPVPEPGSPTLFGTIWITTSVGMGVKYLLTSPLGPIMGYGLLKGRAFGWWLWTILLVNATCTWIAYIHIRPYYNAIPAFAIIGLQGAWLVYRRRLFRPFSFLRRDS